MLLPIAIRGTNGLFFAAVCEGRKLFVHDEMFPTADMAIEQAASAINTDDILTWRHDPRVITEG